MRHSFFADVGRYEHRVPVEREIERLFLREMGASLD
jgi:hypothetical protein